MKLLRSSLSLRPKHVVRVTTQSAEKTVRETSSAGSTSLLSPPPETGDIATSSSVRTSVRIMCMSVCIQQLYCLHDNSKNIGAISSEFFRGHSRDSCSAWVCIAVPEVLRQRQEHSCYNHRNGQTFALQLSGLNDCLAVKLPISMFHSSVIVTVIHAHPTVQLLLGRQPCVTSRQAAKCQDHRLRNCTETISHSSNHPIVRTFN